MKKILMILTSHRLDCFRLCMDLLLEKGSIRFFDRVVLLLNGVTGTHRRYVDSLLAQHPDIPWDTISGPRGRGAFISNLQNECVRRYPDSLYFKIDEDTFVSSDWASSLYNAYTQQQNHPTRALITPVIPNSGLGCWHLLNRFPHLADEYLRLFASPITPDCDGPVWINPRIAQWITRKFLNLDHANQILRASNPNPIVEFGQRFSINCICYDYAHWQEIGGVPEQDEVGWGQWIAAHRKTVLLVTTALVHHYSFFVQQDWLDRTCLLEDIQRLNVPAKSSAFSFWQQYVPCWKRVLRQIPRKLRSRLSLGNTKQG